MKDIKISMVIFGLSGIVPKIWSNLVIWGLKALTGV